VLLRTSRVLLLFALSASFLPSVAQQTVTSSPQAVELLRRALTALSAGVPTSDVTLSGTAHYVAGSDDETGTVVLRAMPGASRMDLNLSSGQRSEVQNTSGASPAGTWSGKDSVSHPISSHNLLTDPAWFFPAFPIARGLSPTGYVATYVGHETRDGQAVEHLTISQSFSIQTPKGVHSFEHLSEMNYFLDSTTLLPAAITFNIHPDDNTLLDIPIEVRFSDYRLTSGIQIPFHIEKYLNDSLILDLQAQTATLNSGLPASTFAVAGGQQ